MARRSSGAHALRLFLLTWLAHACGGQSAPPAPAPLPPMAGPHSIAGIVVSNQTRAPVPGATVTLTEVGRTSTTVTSAEDGGFQFPGVPVDRLQLSISAPGHLDRLTGIQVTGSRGDLIVDLIDTAPPFSLEFYRQFARNGYEYPSNLGRLHPWYTSPRFYVRTVVEDTGETVSPVIIEGLRRVFTNSVPELSAGALQVAAFETGEAARAQQEGWVNVTFVRDLPRGAGQATVGPFGGRYIRIKYRPEYDESNPSSCESFMVLVAEHEVVHTMGYFHTAWVSDFHGAGCTGAGRSDRARYHAAVMYSRAYGNLDRDRDSLGFAIPATASAASTIVSCPAHLFR